MAIDKGLYIAMAGAQSMLRAQAAVANNLANKDTIGFRAENIRTESFKIEGPGLATRVSANNTTPGFDNSMGAILATGNPTDIALKENVWLGVSGSNGDEAFTRAGNLHISAEGVVSTGGGHTVLNEGGSPLTIPPFESLHIGNDGTISIRGLGQGAETMTVVGKLRLADVPDAATLQRGEDGLMRAPESPVQATGNCVKSGMLESSNVDSAGCLVQMIETARSFELQIKLLKSGEEMARSSTSLMRLNG